MKHRWRKYFNVYINHDPVMTLTQFMARSTLVAYAFELGKLLKCDLKGKATLQSIGHILQYLPYTYFVRYKVSARTLQKGA